MKKLIALLLALVMSFSLVSCGSKSAVEITLPAAYFEGTDAADIIASAQKQGFTTCAVNEDGSVTYTMSKAKHQEILKEFKASVDETIQDMIDGDQAVESFQKIEYNDTISEVNIFVDKAKYSPFDGLSGLAFYFIGAQYQTFAGVAEDDIDVVVKFIDQATSETVDTMSYRDFLNASAQADGSSST